MEKKHRLLFAILLVLAVAEHPLLGQTFRIESFQGQDVVAGEILVRFRDGIGIQAQSMAMQDTDLSSAEAVGRNGAVRLRSRNRNTATLLQAYRNRLDVLYAEPNYIFRVHEVPNDAQFNQQWGLRNTGQTIDAVPGTSGADIRSAQAWDITEGSRAIVVGVVDSGVDYTHPDLAANMWSAPAPFTLTIGGQAIACAAGTHGFNAITRTCDPMDDSGHGTHVAGIIAGVGNNGAGVSGVSRVGSIMGLKFIDSTGSGTVADAIAVIEFAIQVKALFPAAANVRVLNNSWGGTWNSRALFDEIALTLSADMLFVASAGNSATTNDLIPNYPATYDLLNIVSVAATDNRDSLAAFSNWGTTTVHLGAPGNDVISTMPAGLYGYKSGTSAASPMVAGAAAMVLSACTLTAPQLRSNLLSNVDSVASLAGRTTTGGRLNVYRSVTACAGPPQPGFRLSVTPGIQTTEVNGAVNLVVTVTSIGGFGEAVHLAVSGLPTGITALFSSDLVTSGSGTSTLTLTTGPTAGAGTYSLSITGTSGSRTSSSGLMLTVGASIAPHQTISGSLSASDQVSPQNNLRYADFYRLTLTSTTAVVIDLKSRVFDTYLYLFASNGASLFASDNEGGSGDSRIEVALAPGTYRIEVTSVDDETLGSYTLSIDTPTLDTISPFMGLPGSSINVTLTGTRFASGMTINAGSGIAVSSVAVVSPALATAVFTLTPNGALTPHDVVVTTGEGTSNPLPFAVPTAISSGQRVSGNLSVTDPISPHLNYRFADMYQLSLTETKSVTIDLRSPDFNAFTYLFSSTGILIAGDDDAGGDTNARLTMSLTAGTYFIEATSRTNRAVGFYSLSINLPVLSSITPIFLAAGDITNVALTGSRFESPFTIDAGADTRSTNLTLMSNSSVVLNLALGSSVAAGPRNITLTTNAGTSNAASFKVFPDIPTLEIGSSVSGTLSSGDATSSGSAGARADLFKFSASGSFLFNLQSSVFDGILFVLSARGEILATSEGPDSGGMVVLRTTLASGTYFLEVTSPAGGSGNYTLSRLRPPSSSMRPNFGFANTTMEITFPGTHFGPPVTIDAGPGISVSNIRFTPFFNLIDNLAATLTIAADAPLGPRNFTLRQFGGQFPLSQLPFTVFPTGSPLQPGEQVRGALTTTDMRSPFGLAEYVDIYRLMGGGVVALDLHSTDFDSNLYLFDDSGNFVADDDESGGNHDARILRGLEGRVYWVFVTSSGSGVGNYTLTAGMPPALTGIVPSQVARGSTTGVTLTGTRFFSPMSAVVGNGMTLTNITPLSATSAIATLTVGSSANPGAHSLAVSTLYGNSPSLNFTVVAPQASQLNFPRLLALSDLAGTGLAVTNPSGTDATVTFTLYSDSGAAVGVANETVPARGQFARLGSELFPTASQPGWIKATSATVGLQSFWVGGNFRSYSDGAVSAPSARDLLFPLVTAQTEINVANTGSAANAVTFRVYGPDGTEQATAVTRSIQTNGIYRNSAASLFPSVNFETTTISIRASGTLDIAGTSVTSDFPVGPSWTVVNGVDASLSLFEVNFAHVPSGPNDGWLSVLGITNLSSTAQAVLITFTSVTGASVQVTRYIAGRATVRESVHTLLGFSQEFRDGWIKVSGTAALNGFLAYGYTGTNGAAVVPGQGIPQSTMIFSQVANGPGWGTGLALLNATSTPANVQVYIMRRSGALVGGADNVATAAFTLPAGTKIAKLLNELVPAANDNDGFVFVRTSNNVPLYGIEVFFTHDVQVMANVSAGAIDPSITFTPPTPAP